MVVLPCDLIIETATRWWPASINVGAGADVGGGALNRYTTIP